MLKNIVIFLLIFYNLNIFSQQGNGKLCINAEPLCGSSMFTYSNTSGNNFAENVPDYGCLILQPNPSWFYFQISQDGDITLQIEQSSTLGGIPNLDVDFIAYGPFDDPTSACVSKLTSSNIVDCSRRKDVIEFINITNTKAGEFYLLLLTNFSKSPGFITVTQTSGNASTNCNLLNPTITSDETSCKGDILTLDAKTDQATSYKWFQDDGNGNFDRIELANNSEYNVTSSNIYKTEAYNNDNVLLRKYEFNIEFFERPIFTFENEYILCINLNGTEEIETPLILDTGLDDSEHSFIWSLNDVVIASETKSYIIPTSEGDYTVEVTSLSTFCSTIKNTTVNFSSPPVITANVITNAFSNYHTIEANTSGIGKNNYQFSIDNGPWQDTGIFNNVSFGEHIITARDTNGCGISSTKVMAIEYPKYFTPNNDGFNDTWNISGLKNQLQAKVYIYNRYGKLLKQLNPSYSSGWDGTFKGVIMPNNDYWFTIEYIEPRDGLIKVFKAHFTLKR